MLFLFVKLNGAVTWIMLERWLTSLKFVDIMGRFTWRWVTPVFAYYLFDEMFASILWYAAGCFFVCLLFSNDMFLIRKMLFVLKVHQFQIGSSTTYFMVWRTLLKLVKCEYCYAIMRYFILVSSLLLIDNFLVVNSITEFTVLLIVVQIILCCL
jgi:hypothetical protein